MMEPLLAQSHGSPKRDLRSRTDYELLTMSPPSHGDPLLDRLKSREQDKKPSRKQPQIHRSPLRDRSPVNQWPQEKLGLNEQNEKSFLPSHQQNVAPDEAPLGKPHRRVKKIQQQMCKDQTPESGVRTGSPGSPEVLTPDITFTPRKRCPPVSVDLDKPPPQKSCKKVAEEHFVEFIDLEQASPRKEENSDFSKNDSKQIKSAVSTEKRCSVSPEREKISLENATQRSDTQKSDPPHYPDGNSEYDPLPESPAYNTRSLSPLSPPLLYPQEQDSLSSPSPPQATAVPSPSPPRLSCYLTETTSPSTSPSPGQVTASPTCVANSPSPTPLTSSTSAPSFSSSSAFPTANCSTSLEQQQEAEDTPSPSFGRRKVEAVVDQKWEDKKLFYLCKWEGWPSTHNTWVDARGERSKKKSIAKFLESRGNRVLQRMNEMAEFVEPLPVHLRRFEQSVVPCLRNSELQVLLSKQSDPPPVHVLAALLEEEAAEVLQLEPEEQRKQQLSAESWAEFCSLMKQKEGITPDQEPSITQLLSVLKEFNSKDRVGERKKSILSKEGKLTGAVEAEGNRKLVTPKKMLLSKGQKKSDETNNAQEKKVEGQEKKAPGRVEAAAAEKAKSQNSSPLKIDSVGVSAPKQDSPVPVTRKQTAEKRKLEDFEWPVVSLSPDVLHIMKLRELKRRRIEQQRSLLAWQTALNTRDAPPITVVNDVDLEEAPRDFKAVQANVFSARVKHPEGVHQCECPSGGCAENCPCVRRSGKKVVYNADGKIVVNAEVYVYECNSRCSCGRDGGSCQNRVVQSGRKVPLEIFRTKDRGWGVRVLQDVSKGTFLCELVGEILHNNEMKSREKTKLYANRAVTLFELLDNKHKYWIDTVYKANESRFVNHSCEPNSAPYYVWSEWLDKDLPRPCIFATKSMPAGTEITYDYYMGIIPRNGVPNGKKSKANQWRVPCKCGSTRKCTGYIF